MAVVDIHVPYNLGGFDGTFKSKSKCRGTKQLCMMMEAGFDTGSFTDWNAHAQQPQGLSMSIAELTRLSIEQSTTEGSTTVTMETYTALPPCADVMTGGLLTTDGSFASTSEFPDLDTVLETCKRDDKMNQKKDMCRILSISEDVGSWSPQDVHDWLEWAGKEHDLPQESLAQALTNFDNQQLTGCQICGLTLDSFCVLFPRECGGDIVYGLLQEWKDDFPDTYPPASFPAPPALPFHPENNQKHHDIIISSNNPMLSAPHPVSVQWSPPTGHCWETVSHQRYEGACSTGTVSPGVSSSPDDAHFQKIKIEISDTEDDDIDLSYLHNKGWRNPALAPSGPGYPKKRRSGGQPILWLFLHDCLAKPEEWSHAIKWVNREEGIFQFSSEHKEKVARRWGEIKGNRCVMSYQKMARSLRNYSNNNVVLRKVRRKLQYQFLPRWANV